MLNTFKKEMLWLWKGLDASRGPDVEDEKPDDIEEPEDEEEDEGCEDEIEDENVRAASKPQSFIC